MDFENNANPNEERKESIQHWRELATVDTTESKEIISAAKKLHKLGINKKDSLHLASAITLGCDVFFTTDDGILRARNHIKKIKILNPIEYYADYHD